MQVRALRTSLNAGLIARTVAMVRIATGRLSNICAIKFFCIALAFLLITLLLVWLVCRLYAERLETSRNLRFQNQLAERTRIARDLNDNLLQTIEASKMIADDAIDLPADPVRLRRTMIRLSDWLGKAIKEGQQALDSLRISSPENSDLTASPLSNWIRELSRRLRPARDKPP
jgi:signal transduction histidine kinase